MSVLTDDRGEPILCEICGGIQEDRPDTQGWYTCINWYDGDHRKEREERRREHERD